MKFFTDIHGCHERTLLTLVTPGFESQLLDGLSLSFGTIEIPQNKSVKYLQSSAAKQQHVIIVILRISMHMLAFGLIELLTSL